MVKKAILLLLLLFLCLPVLGQVDPFTLPTALGAGETARVLWTTNSWKVDASDPARGSITTGAHSGQICRWASSPLGDNYDPGWLYWDGIAAPADQAKFTKLYLVLKTTWTGGYFKYVNVSVDGGSSYGGWWAYSNGQGQFSDLVADGAPATTYDLTQVAFKAFTDASTSTSYPATCDGGGDQWDVVAIGAIAYYPAQQDIRSQVY